MHNVYGQSRDAEFEDVITFDHFIFICFKFCIDEIPSYLSNDVANCWQNLRFICLESGTLRFVAAER